MKPNGCGYREFCEAYKEKKYLKSSFLSPNFMEKCDALAHFNENCPMYDIYEGLLKFTREILDKTNKSLDETIKEL